MGQSLSYFNVVLVAAKKKKSLNVISLVFCMGNIVSGDENRSLLIVDTARGRDATFHFYSFLFGIFLANNYEYFFI